MAIRNLAEDQKAFFANRVVSLPPATTLPAIYRIHPRETRDVVVGARTLLARRPTWENSPVEWSPSESLGSRSSSRVAFRGIDAKVSYDGEQWWALDEGGTDVFGEGDTRNEAVLDLVASIGTMLADLTANRDRLSDHAADQLRRFERALAEE